MFSEGNPAVYAAFYRFTDVIVPGTFLFICELFYSLTATIFIQTFSVLT